MEESHTEGSGGGTVSSVNLIHGDCLEHMRSMPAGSVDAVVTDPPYGIGYQSNMRKNKFSHMANDDITNAIWLPFMVNIIKPGGSLYCFSRWDVLGTWKSLMEFFGLEVRNCIVWDKELGGMGNLKGAYAPSHEMILFATRGNPNLKRKRPRDVIRTQRIGGSRCHPTEKPVEVLEELILNSTLPADVVLDPFMGSGTTGVACVNLKREFIGIELDETYFELAQKRIREAGAQMALDL